MRKRKNFWFPDNDEHFSGDPYQVPHRQIALQACKNFRTAIDVGAHVGTWAVDMQALFERVIAFEPVPEHIECLKLNTDPSKIEIHNVALGDKEGEVSLAYAEGDNSGTCSVYEEGAYTAPLRTLDSYNFKDVDYIKVDVEGYEMQFLTGARDTILLNEPVVSIEIKPTCERFGYTQFDIIQEMKNLGMVNIDRVIDDWVWGFA